MPQLDFLLSRKIWIGIAALILSSSAVAQINSATCTFKVFGLANNGVGITSVNGANRWGTTAGQVNAPNKMPNEQGFIRYADGSVHYVAPPQTYRAWLNGINDNGVAIGFYDTGTSYSGFMMQKSILTRLVNPKASPAFAQDTRPNGINKWNTIVGQYLPASGVWTGFRRYSNGSYTDLAYPGSKGTRPNAINDSGFVVGEYDDANYNAHGFMYLNGKLASLDFPLSAGTSLTGVDNNGVILGNGYGWGSFLYVKGVFKVMPGVPNSSSTTFNGLSPDGLFSGVTTDSSGQSKGFIAACK